jgi:hypothetical protein
VTADGLVQDPLASLEAGVVVKVQVTYLSIKLWSGTLQKGKSQVESLRLGPKFHLTPRSVGKLAL